MRRGKEGEPFGKSDMHEFVTQIGRYDRLSEYHDSEGETERADFYREAALRTGVAIIEATEKDEKSQAELTRALKWLKGRDYEQHGVVEGILGAARAVRNVTGDAMRAKGKPGTLLR